MTTRAYEFHVSALLTASTDISVIASSQEEAIQKIRAQLHLRDSQVTRALRDSASEQIRKEMNADDFAIDLTDERDATEDDLEDEVSA